MKRFLKFIGISMLIVSVVFAVYKFNNKYVLNMFNKNIDWTITHKGIKDARSFDVDKEGNIYIAFEDSILIVKEDKKEKTLIKKDTFNIYDMVIYKDDIIIATGNEVIKYNVVNDEAVDIITTLPNNGLNRETKLMIKDDKLFITIGSNTNSGVVDNENSSFDIPTFQWKLTGENYGEGKTGPFSKYGVSVNDGFVLKDEVLSNGTIICYDFNTEKVENYAAGIRNIEGIDYDTEGNIIAIVGGIEDQGSRPLKEDKDYIYMINENYWYGWPDYSGGDPVSSPRFSTESDRINEIIKNPPTRIPSGPMYQHINIDSLKGLTIDREGKILGKDVIIFADNKENYLYALINKSVANKIVDLGDKSKVEVIRCYDDGVYVLDSKMGYLYKLKIKNSNIIFNLPIPIWGFIAVFFIAVIIIISLKKDNNTKKKAK